MITRVYITNFRSFVNFEWKPEKLHLLFGKNGSGKTSLVDVMALLRNVIVEGAMVKDVFDGDSLTAWLDDRTQIFEVDFQDPKGRISYRLEVEHHQFESGKCRIKEEVVKADNGSFLYRFDGTEVHLFRDNGEPGPSFPHDLSRSAIATIPERGDFQRLTWFREQWQRLLLFSPNPLRMLADADSEMHFPDRSLSHIVGWLRHLSQDSFDVVSRIQEEMRVVMPGFEQFQLAQAGERTRTLKFLFSEEGKGKHKLSFNHLSDGQRQLFALYLILEAAVKETRTVFIDEPDNYVALREIQPWLTTLRDKVEESGAQVIMISHHPEVIDALASGAATWFYREGAGFSRNVPFKSDHDDGLKASEIAARDLIDG